MMKKGLAVKNGMKRFFSSVSADFGLFDMMIETRLTREEDRVELIGIAGLKTLRVYDVRVKCVLCNSRRISIVVVNYL